MPISYIQPPPTSHASFINQGRSAKAAYDQGEGLPKVNLVVKKRIFSLQSVYCHFCFAQLPPTVDSSLTPSTSSLIQNKTSHLDHIDALQNRLIKEAAYYEKETKENEAQLQKMKDEQKDPYDIKKFEEVLGESQMMIPESISRRDKALDDLREFVAVLEKDEADNNELMTCEWMVRRRNLLRVMRKKRMEVARMLQSLLWMGWQKERRFECNSRIERWCHFHWSANILFFFFLHTFIRQRQR